MPKSERIARLLVLPLALLFGFLLIRGSGTDDPDPVTTDGAALEATTTVAQGPSSTRDEPRTSAESNASTAAETITTDSPSSAELDLRPADTSQPPVEPRGTYRDGAIVLAGSVADVETAEAYVSALADVVGEGNVTVELTRDARVSADTMRIDVARAFALPETGTSSDPGLASLAGVATDVLDAFPESRLVITGHTDAVGTESTNLALSVARSRLVVEDLVERGLPRDRLVAAGAGESQPIAANETPEGRQANRRITAAFEGITPG